MKSIFVLLVGASLHLFLGEKEMGDVLNVPKSASRTYIFNCCEKLHILANFPGYRKKTVKGVVRAVARPSLISSP